MNIDFDSVDQWSEPLRAVLAEHLPADITMRLRAADLEFVEDAFEALCVVADRDSIIKATISWIEANSVVGFHGTRVTDSEFRSIRKFGLQPLNAAERKGRLEQALSPHPDWTKLCTILDQTINDIGKAEKYGSREGQVHLTLSRAGLINSFNHYLEFGSEFDQRVVEEILGEEGLALLRLHGKPLVIKVAVPGEDALAAANRFFTVEDTLRAGETPNVVSELLHAWSFKAAQPNFEATELKRDCGLMFFGPLPPSSIIEYEWLDHFHSE